MAIDNNKLIAFRDFNSDDVLQKIGLKNNSSLTTTSKEVVGAINELKTKDSTFVTLTTNQIIRGQKTFVESINLAGSPFPLVTETASIMYDPTNECIKFVFN